VLLAVDGVDARGPAGQHHMPFRSACDRTSGSDRSRVSAFG
jgi:hypothetical protein